MIKRLQTFFRKLTPVGRIIWAIASPLVLFLIIYPAAESSANQYEQGGAFDFSDTGLWWIIFVVLVGVIEYAIWQPPIES